MSECDEGPERIAAWRGPVPGESVPSGALPEAWFHCSEGAHAARHPQVVRRPRRAGEVSTSHLLGLVIRSPVISLRISHLEMLDEIEELELVLEHYAITWGVKIPANGGAVKADWAGWDLEAYADDDDEAY